MSLHQALPGNGNNFAVGREKEEKKKEWVGKSHKTIVLTASKDIEFLLFSMLSHS